jgi:hypothetical protein
VKEEDNSRNEHVTIFSLEKSIQQRLDVAIAVREGRNLKVNMSVTDASFAYKLSNSVTEGFRENDMALMMYSQDQGRIVSINVFRRFVGDYDLVQLIPDRNEQVKTLSGWYCKMYDAVQRGNTEGAGELRYKVFEQTLPAFGIDKKGYIDSETAHMFRGYTEDQDVYRGFELIRNISLRILEATRGLEDPNQVHDLGVLEAQIFAGQLWDIIGEINPKVLETLKIDRPIEAMRQATAVTQYSQE